MPRRVPVVSALVIATLSILTACGRSATPFANSMAPVQNVHPAKKSDLIYVADNSAATVYVYTYPQLAPTQTLTGFGVPTGLCSDKKGDVFVADYLNADVVEYAHGGSSPIATISDRNHSPAGCAVNAKNGDLAVSSLHNTTTTGAHGPATVSIYKPKYSSSMLYSDTGASAFWYCAYDPHGNLFVDGYNKSGNKTILAELPAGGKSSFTNLTLKTTVFGPGGLQWNGKYLAMSDQNSSIYQLAISGGNATVHGTTTLSGGSGVYEFQISGADVAATISQSGSFGIWKYPAGGDPLNTVSGLITPLGLTISKGK